MKNHRNRNSPLYDSAPLRQSHGRVNGRFSLNASEDYNGRVNRRNRRDADPDLRHDRPRPLDSCQRVHAAAPVRPQRDIGVRDPHRDPMKDQGAGTDEDSPAAVGVIHRENPSQSDRLPFLPWFGVSGGRTDAESTSDPHTRRGSRHVPVGVRGPDDFDPWDAHPPTIERAPANAHIPIASLWITACRGHPLFVTSPHIGGLWITARRGHVALGAWPPPAFQGRAARRGHEAPGPFAPVRPHFHHLGPESGCVPAIPEA